MNNDNDKDNTKTYTNIIDTSYDSKFKPFTLL